MSPQIKIELLNNDFYSVTGVNAQKVNISYMDFQTTTTTTSTTTSQYGNMYPITISPNVFTKTIQLEYLDISLNPYFDFKDMKNVYFLYDKIKSEINKSYFNKLTELGDKNRDTAPVNMLDINLKDIKLNFKNENRNISRQIITKFNTSSSYIATTGRIGPAQWILSNSNTYKYILSHLDSDQLEFKDHKLMIGNIPYLVNDSVDDDIILFGRKNRVDSSGIHCFILSDDSKNIYFQEICDSVTYQKRYRIYYKIDDIGINPEYQYLELKTRNISYYRAKKLQKIKELYGL